MLITTIRTIGDEPQQGEKKEVEEGRLELMGEKGCSEKDVGTN